jgi:hypothetical protein
MSLHSVSENAVRIYVSGEDSYSSESDLSEGEDLVARTELQAASIRSPEEQVPTQVESPNRRQKRVCCVLEGLPMNEESCVTDLWAKLSVCGHECETINEVSPHDDLIDFDAPFFNHIVDEEGDFSIDLEASNEVFVPYPNIPAPGTDLVVQRPTRPPAGVVLKAGTMNQGDSESCWFNLRMGRREFDWSSS